MSSQEQQDAQQLLHAAAWKLSSPGHLVPGGANMSVTLRYQQMGRILRNYCLDVSPVSSSILRLLNKHQRQRCVDAPLPQLQRGSTQAGGNTRASQVC